MKRKRGQLRDYVIRRARYVPETEPIHYTYYVGMTPIGPVFDGETLAEAKHFPSKAVALAETLRHWAFTETDVISVRTRNDA